MSQYRLSHTIINRTRRRCKLVDGAGLYFMRNGNGSLTAWQRQRDVDGRVRDIKVAGPIAGAIDGRWLMEIRAGAFALRGTGADAGGQEGSQSFEAVWTAYLAAVSRWTAETRAKYETRMKRWVGQSALWSKPVARVSPAMVAAAVAGARRERPLLTPRLLLDISNAFDWLLAKGAVSANPAAAYMKSLRVVETRAKPQRLPALVELGALRRLLVAIETSDLCNSLRSALVFQAFTAQRSGTVAAARWQDVDLEAATWTIPRASMKEADDDRPDHVVALHPAMLALLAKLPRTSPWVFPAQYSPTAPIQKKQLSRALIRLGFDGIHTPHGWRSALKTLADDAADKDGRPLFHPRWVEDVLDHKVLGVQGHYSRAAAIAGMRHVLLWWGDLLAANSETRGLASANR